jgi:hypothetical protein
VLIDAASVEHDLATALTRNSAPTTSAPDLARHDLLGNMAPGGKAVTSSDEPSCRTAPHSQDALANCR